MAREDFLEAGGMCLRLLEMLLNPAANFGFEAAFAILGRALMI